MTGDDNGRGDVFLFDRQTDTMTLVSKALDGSSGNGRSDRSEISADGSYVVFQSTAVDLVAMDTKGVGQVYGYEVATGAITLLSLGINGAADQVVGDASVSRDGNQVLFRTFSILTNCPPDCGYLYVRQRLSNTTVIVPQSNSLSAGRASISGDGRYVAWSDSARTYLIDRSLGTSTLLEQSDLTFNPRSWSRFSDDSRYFVFWESLTTGTSSYRLWRYDIAADLAEVVSLDSNGSPLTEGATVPASYGRPGITDDGNIVAFWSAQDGVVEGDTGGITDVYVTTLTGDFQAPAVGSITIDPLAPLAREAFTLSATADDSGTGGAAIISGEFAINGGDWLAAEATDGDFDSPVESFERTISGLAAGPYEVCVRATDGFGNQSDGLECAKLDIAANPDIIEILISNPPLLPGGSFEASAGGFKPLSLVQAFLESTPVLVGEQSADSNGDVAFTITVPNDFPPGIHTLALEGVDPDDAPRRLTTPITIEQGPVVLQSGFEAIEDP